MHYVVLYYPETARWLSCRSIPWLTPWVNLAPYSRIPAWSSQTASCSSCWQPRLLSDSIPSHLIQCLIVPLCCSPLASSACFSSCLEFLLSFQSGASFLSVLTKRSICLHQIWKAHHRFQWSLRVQTPRPSCARSLTVMYRRRLRGISDLRW